MKRVIPFFILTALFLSSLSAQVYEAEEGKNSGVTPASEIQGYTGSGYLAFSSFLSGKCEITVQTKKEGDYALKFRYALKKPDANSAVKVVVDKDYYISTQKLPQTMEFTECYANNLMHLTKGQHIITVSGMNDGVLLDSIEVVAASKEIRKKVTPPSQLVTPNPSKEAVALYNYLCDQKGKGILSGQQIYNSGTEDVEAVAKVTGKNPAILGIDLIDFSPSRVSRGANGARTIPTAIQWWEDGGLITCCWHWNAPADLVDKNEPNKRWYEGFRTQATTFNWVKGVRDHESEEYKLLIRDIDAIAIPLMNLQLLDVPVLWRPLHEASGGWFWWGSKGAENYILLYQLVFDRLVNHHKLDNLIWVWNAQDPKWYPGDEYVDILSYDSYPGKHKHGTVTNELAKIQSATTQAKLCAISENGAIPDINKLAETKSVWSWFCTWNGEFTVGKNKAYSEEYTSADLLKQWYDTDWLITRDEVKFKK